MIPQHFIDSLLDRVDLPAFIGQYVPDLKRKSEENFSACCPFHGEKTPSFTVSVRKRFYHCFGCGAHGNAIKFAMEHKGLNFPDAVREVAGFAGMEVPKEDVPERTAEQKREAARYAKAYAVLADAQRVYGAELSKNVDAMEYLTEVRGLSFATINSFGIGYAPDEWNTITGNRAYKKEELMDSGLAAHSEKSPRLYDRFRDRIMVPIYYKDRVVGFGGRTMRDQEPKYLNSPESLVFKKGNLLFGLPQAIDEIRKQGRVYVVEGYMDDIMLHQHGITNVVASLGTAVTESQMKILFALSEHVTFCMDGDNPGRKASWRIAETILPLMDDRHKVDFMFLPDEMDPDDFVRKAGKEGFEQAAHSAKTLTEYLLDELKREADMNNAESMAFYFAAANDLAMKLPNGALMLAFQKQVAEGANVSLDAMLNSLNAGKKPVQEAPQPQAAKVASANISVAAKILGLASIASREFAAELHPEGISMFLGEEDREFLLPLLGYLRANPQATAEQIVATLSYNPHAKMIRSLVSAESATKGIDLVEDGKAVLDSFRRLGIIWAAVRDKSA